MGREDIEEMIASTLDALEEPPERFDPAQRILDRYAALVREDEGETDRDAEASSGVALPAAPVALPAAPPAPPLASRMKRLLGRMRR